MAPPDVDSGATHPDGLAEYKYSGLSDPTRNIRVIRLLPSSFDDDVKILIQEVTLECAATQEPTNRLSLKELQATIPKHTRWRVYKTLDDRFVFSKPTPNGFKFSYIHPSPNFDKTKYQRPPDILHGGPPYEALSYVWGSESEQDSVTVEHEMPSQRATLLGIRPNLKLILRHLRLQHKTRTLWIDAICINQKDQNERETQVTRMASIYTLASRVVIWMGLSTHTTPKALKILAKISRQVNITTSRFPVPSPHATTDWWDHRVEIPLESQHIDCIVELFHRPWMGRLWTVQEAHLGNRRSIMKWGKYSIPVLDVYRVVRCLERKDKLPRPGLPGLPPEHLRSVLSDVSETLGIQRGLSFPELLFAVCRKECTDSRDIIYGVLGMAPPKVAALIRPDYSPASTYRGVYRDAFLAYTKLTKRLEMFWGGESTPPDWPSWIPIFGRIAEPGGYVYMPADGFSAGCSSADVSYDANNSDVLRVLGTRVGAISQVEGGRGIESDGVPAHWSCTAGLSSLFRKLRSQRQIIPESRVHRLKMRIDGMMANLDPDGPYIGGGTLREAYCRLAGDGCQEDDVGIMRMTLGETWDWMVNSQPNASRLHTDHLSAQQSRGLFICEGGRFVKTVQGYIGLGPTSAIQGSDTR